MSVSSTLIPAVSTSIITGNNPICAGDLITFTASSNNGGVSPIYQWQINGINVGSNSPTFSVNSLTHAQVVTCVMISALSCSSPSFATSAAITVTVHPIPSTPQISPSGNIGICEGNSILLSSSALTGNLWSTNATSQTISVDAVGNYSVTQTQNGCISLPSAVVTITAHPQPTATILPAGPFCIDAASRVVQTLTG